MKDDNFKKQMTALINDITENIKNDEISSIMMVCVKKDGDAAKAIRIQSDETDSMLKELELTKMILLQRILKQRQDRNITNSDDE